MAGIMTFYTAHGIDLLLMPVASSPAVHHGRTENADERYTAGVVYVLVLAELNAPT